MSNNYKKLINDFNNNVYFLRSGDVTDYFVYVYYIDDWENVLYKAKEMLKNNNNVNEKNKNFWIQRNVFDVIDDKLIYSFKLEYWEISLNCLCSSCGNRNKIRYHPHTKDIYHILNFDNMNNKETYYNDIENDYIKLNY